MTIPDTTTRRRAAVLETARAVVAHEAQGVAASVTDLGDVFLDVVQRVYECTGKVFVTGAGTSGAVARRMAHLLSVSGTPSVFISGADALHGTMGAMAPGDILVAISRGGGSDEINDLVVRAKERGVDTVVAVTADATSRLARNADVVVELTMIPGIDPGEVIAMGSTLVTAAWGDALAVVLMRMRGYSWANVLHSHPSGAVGKIDEAPQELPPLEPYWK
ncbi:MULTISPECIES: KpsF/GutQ family sugar-phosphate isomerase [Cellulosimicrobium]|uniref:KpsF/GutQ family sugar-phosphate isomerase n=1 Tax=Cellulosimicrobium TaxID=157920 RepID=UPI00209841E5|nr:SIS domain-containing protein [Cellulosimicrobium cellulans]MCO7273328.1 SIS domain-containing protein [Cellulosimicrobium cellulans]